MKKQTKKEIEHWLTLNIGIPILYVLSRLIGLTLRVERVGPHEEFFRSLDEGRRYIVAFWHGDSFYIANEFSLLKPHGDTYVMTSRSRDGALMARFLKIAGAGVVRGSSSRGGGRALLEMIRRMRPRDFGALAVDAPRGPRHKVNRDGVLLLAQRAERPLYPGAIRAEKKWVFRSWDRMEIPKPFSRIKVYYGGPIEVPPDAGSDEIARLRGELERRLNELKGEDA